MDVSPLVPLGLDLIDWGCMISVNTPAGPSWELNALLFLPSSYPACWLLLPTHSELLS